MAVRLSAAVTLDICTGLFDDDLAALAKRMDALVAQKASRSVGTVRARDSVVKVDYRERTR